MSLIRLVSDEKQRDVDNQFNCSFDDDIVIDKNSEVCLHSCNAELLSDGILIDSNNNDIEVQVKNDNKYKYKINLDFNQYTPDNYAELLSNLFYKLNAGIPLCEDKFIGLKWLVQLDNNKKLNIGYQISAQYNLFSSTKPSDVSIQNLHVGDYLIHSTNNEDLTTFRNGGISTSEFINSCGYASASYSIVDNNNPIYETGVLMLDNNKFSEFTNETIETQHVKFGVIFRLDSNHLGDIAHEYIKVYHNSASISEIFPADLDRSEDFTITLEHHSNKIFYYLYYINLLGSSERIQLGLSDGYDYIQNDKIYNAVVSNSTNIEFYNVSTVDDVNNWVNNYTSINDYHHAPNKEIIYHPANGNTELLKLNQPTQNTRVTNNQLIFKSSILSSFLGFDSNLLPIQISWNLKYIADRKIAIGHLTQNFLILLKDLNVDCYDSFDGKNRSILDTIPYDPYQTDGRIIYSPNRFNWMKLNNDRKILIRNITVALVNSDLSPVRINNRSNIFLKFRKSSKEEI